MKNRNAVLPGFHIYEIHKEYKNKCTKTGKNWSNAFYEKQKYMPYNDKKEKYQRVYCVNVKIIKLVWINDLNN